MQASIHAADLNYAKGESGDNLISGNRGPGLAGTESDVAMLNLNTALGSVTGWMALDPNFKGGTVNLTGYPGAKGQNMTNDVAYAWDDTAADDGAIDNYTNISRFETHGGNSGGPVWYADADGRGHVVGLVSTGLGAYDVANHYNHIQSWIGSNDHMIVA